MSSSVYLTESETEDTSSSVEVLKKKRFSSILKYKRNNVKKKCAAHRPPEPEPAARPARAHNPVSRLRGILKHDRDLESSDVITSSDEEAPGVLQMQARCLVGRVPRPAGAKPGRGGGVALVIRRNVSVMQHQPSYHSPKKPRQMMRKRSY